MVMDKTLETITITEKKVYKKLENLKVRKTPGCDGIYSSFERSEICHLQTTTVNLPREFE